MTEFYDQEQDQGPVPSFAEKPAEPLAEESADALILPEDEDPAGTADSQEPLAEIAPARQDSNWRRAIRGAITAAGAVGLVYGVVGLFNEKSSTVNKANSSIQTRNGAHGPGAAAIVQDAVQTYPAPADFSGTYCGDTERTFQPGETVYSLSTEGLHHGDRTFMNIVYSINVAFVLQQARTNPGLRNLNDVQPGTHIKIKDNCQTFTQVQAYYESQDNGQFTQGYGRTVEYQAYAGSDGNTHNSVIINYKTDKQGNLESVLYCGSIASSLECPDYVADRPSNKTVEGITDIGPLG